MKQPLPNEIINHIMSFRTKNPVFLLLQSYFLYNLQDNSNNTKDSYLYNHCYGTTFHHLYLCLAKKKRNIHNHILQKI
jgi:hypothetical protein